MLSKNNKVMYYAPKTSKPAIISPKGLDDWQKTRYVTFVWKYNGYDKQQQFQIQIFNINILNNDIPVSWIMAGATKEQIGNCACDLTESSIETRKSIDLSLYGIPANGVFLWRIRTRGSIATEWSDWTIDGRVMIDSTSPIIRNITAESPYDMTMPMASYFSDMSFPNVDGHINTEENKKGLYIYYDYRDNSIVIRCQSGTNSSSGRYYGMISFHSDSSNPQPMCSISDAIKAAYVFKVKKDAMVEYGPYEETSYHEQFFGGKNFNQNTEGLIYTSENTSPYIPMGFPRFWSSSSDIYNEDQLGNASNYPVGMDFNTNTFLSVFPFSTKYCSSRTYKFGSTQETILDFIEMRYPSPYQDLFILFDTNMSKIKAYGKYSNMSDVLRIETGQELSTDVFTVASWFNVDKNRETKPTPQPLIPLTDSILTRPYTTVMKDASNTTYSVVLKSNYMFFNICSDSSGDSAIKIYLNDIKFKFKEKGESDVKIPFIEFNFRPDSDCGLSRKGNVNLSGYRKQIAVDEIFIGKARTSPRDLSMFRFQPLTAKQIYKSLKCADNTLSGAKVNATCLATLDYFTEDSTKYNGSFRLRIPEYKFVPYYHPNAANYIDNKDTAPIPHILDADPKNANWDSIYIESYKENVVSNYVKISDNPNLVSYVECVYNKIGYIGSGTTTNPNGTDLPLSVNFTIFSIPYDASVVDPPKILDFFNLYNIRLLKTMPQSFDDVSVTVNPSTLSLPYRISNTTPIDWFFIDPPEEYSDPKYSRISANVTNIEDMEVWNSMVRSYHQYSTVGSVFEPIPGNENAEFFVIRLFFLVGSLVSKVSEPIATQTDRIRTDFLYPGDYVQFSGSTKYLGQINPYLYNFFNWNNDPDIDSKATRGSILRLKDFGWMKDANEYCQLGESMYEDGWSQDGVQYNQIDRALFSITSIQSISSGKSKISLNNFSNHLFRKSLSVTIDESISGSDLFTYSIKPVRSDSTHTYIWGQNSVLDSDINDEGLESNGPIWIFNNETDDLSKASFINALIGSDVSAQGNFGTPTEGRDLSWAKQPSNLFAGYYLIVDKNGEMRKSEQIDRTIVGQPNSSNTYFIRSQIKDNDGFSVTSSVDKAYISGDTFSIGNIFGFITPVDAGGGIKTVRLFLDIKENDSGISGLKFFQAELPQDETDLKEIPDIFTANANYKILMQRINNKTFDINYSDSIASALENISNSRSSMDLISYYMDNYISKWSDVQTEDGLSSGNLTDYGKSRFFFDMPIKGNGGFSLIYVKVKDRSGNESNVYCLPIFILGQSDTISPSMSIDSVDIAADLNIIDKKEPYTGMPDVSKYLLGNDNDTARTISLRSILTKNGDDYEIYEGVQDLVVGFSDNYGLSYNVFSPISSIVPWSFTRPIAVPVKGFTKSYRGQEWFFDPNDIRHYERETYKDYSFGLNVPSNTKNNFQTTGLYFHVPSHGSLQNVTLIGLMEESNIVQWGKSNPIAKKILENKEEFIGRKLTLGSDLNQSFTILDIFKEDYLPIVKKWIDANTSRSIDGDGTATNKRPKVWIMVEDPDSICALVLSRKYAYKDASIKEGTGYRKLLSGTSRSTTNDFGYYQTLDKVPASVNRVVNAALNMSSDIDAPNAGSVTDGLNLYQTGDQYFYIVPSEPIPNDSGIPTNEGWITQIYQAYNPEDMAASGLNILQSLKNNQFLGLTVYNRLVFGESVTLSCLTCRADEFVFSNGTFSLEEGNLDRTIVGMTCKLYRTTGELITPASGQSLVIQEISDDGKHVSVSGLQMSDIMSSSPDSRQFYLKIEIDPLQSVDTYNREPYSIGWWPDIDGVLIPYAGAQLGTINSASTSAKYVKYAVVSSGSFYAHESGYYQFKIETDTLSYADFCIDYMRESTLVENVVRIDSGYQEEVVGGLFSKGVTTRIYLAKGWHVGRFRYVANNNLIANSSTIEYPKYFARVMFSKPGWDETSWTPFMGSLESGYNFLARGFRRINCQIKDNQNNTYPLQSGSLIGAQHCSATIGFSEPIVQAATGIYGNQVVDLEKSLVGSTGNPIKNAPRSIGMTYSAQIFEKAYGVYESNIIDGGSDFRYWKTINWDLIPSEQPEGTTVEFFIRTASTEKELLAKSWNNIGDQSEEIILDPITQPGTNLVRFSQPIIGANNNLVLNRFLQFKMVLTSIVPDVTPTINEVTIQYSRQNTLNFFTTTFNLTSNIVRAILSYNGEVPVDPSGVKISDIQFGICTEEESNGGIKTNFDDYTIIPVNEAFSLSSLNVQQNDKFRIGIKFISTEGSIPSVDEFGIMWTTDGEGDQSKDLMSK